MPVSGTYSRFRVECKQDERLALFVSVDYSPVSKSYDEWGHDKTSHPHFGKDVIAAVTVLESGGPGSR